jgi:DNA-binding HxlR family transcriptional regulator
MILYCLEKRAGKTMPKAKAGAPRGCPVAAFQKVISGKYKLRIIWDLKDGPLRYSEIRTGLLRGLVGTQEITPRVLSRELKGLTQSELVARKDYGLVPPKVEYRLTAKGRSFVPFVSAIPRMGRTPPEAHRAGARQHRSGVGAAQFARMTRSATACAGSPPSDGP